MRNKRNHLLRYAHNRIFTEGKHARIGRLPVRKLILPVRACRITRLAQGVPIGGELDYLDDGTLTAALKARRAVSAG